MAETTLLQTALPLWLYVCSLLTSPVQATLWSRALQTEIFNRTFGGVRLCTSLPNNSVNITALDQYTVPTPTLTDPFYNVRSQFSQFVLDCETRASPDAIFIFLKAFFVSSIRWDDVCANTRNLTIFMVSSSSPNDTSYQLQPCNYTNQFQSLTVEQVTSWILLTYTADWNADWVNRTASYPESIDAATVVFRSGINPRWNFTLRNVLASGLSTRPMSSSEKALAVLASVSKSEVWWLLICSVTNSSGNNLLLSVRGHSAKDTLQEFYMNCSTRTSLVYGAPSSAISAADASAIPAIESQTGGYWGRQLQKLLTSQPFGGVSFCQTSIGGLLVSGTDDIVVSRVGGTLLIRSTFLVQLIPCSSKTEKTTSEVGDALLKTLVRTQANWKDVCTDSISPLISVNLDNRTAVQFRPCPQASDPDVGDVSAIASKTLWCILALNTSQLSWINRDSSTSVDASAARVTFRIFGDLNATTLQWGNVLVNGLATGDQVDRVVQVFRLVDTTYWPITCKLFNTTIVDSYLNISISDGNSSKNVSLYTNCRFPSELSTTPPERLTTTSAQIHPSTPAVIASTSSTPIAERTSQPFTVSVTVSPESIRALELKQNLAFITAQKQRDEFATQIAVILVVLLLLAVLCTIGLCKMVLPRSV